MNEEAFLEVKKKGTKQGREFDDSTGEKAIQRWQRDLSLPKEKSKVRWTTLLNSVWNNFEIEWDILFCKKIKLTPLKKLEKYIFQITAVLSTFTVEFYSVKRKIK